MPAPPVALPPAPPESPAPPLPAAKPRPRPLPPPAADPAPAAAPAASTASPPPPVSVPVAAEVSPPAALPPDWPPPVPEEEAEEAVPAAPARVEIDFQIRRKGGLAGVERHVYQATAEGTYSLSSVAEAKGLLAIALSDLVQKSEGRITPQGLRPDHYLYHYGKNPDKAQNAEFDWTTHALTMTVGSKRQSAELQAGTQDLMSFLYQFMFQPPLQEMQISITNGKRLRTYAYGFEGEETLETAMGSLRVLHIGRSSNDEEKTELWLAMDYHYLPVKISKTEKDGTVTERIATRLKIE
ncbi:MAG: DUF3108 domain-containing protein [Methylobacterium sp.]|nr:DUF3108 domain-containing protein [Methylobacterium sp.]